MEHEKIADQAERDAADLERRSERLGREIDQTRADFERKQHDDRVPGIDDPNEERIKRDKEPPPGGMERE